MSNVLELQIVPYVNKHVPNQPYVISSSINLSLRFTNVLKQRENLTLTRYKLYSRRGQPNHHYQVSLGILEIGWP